MTLDVRRNFIQMISQRLLVEILSIITMTASIFLMVALLSYSPQDKALITSSSLNHHILHNLGGWVGAMTSEFLYTQFGLASLLFPFLFFIWGLCLFLDVAIKFHPQQIIGFILLISFVCPILEISLRRYHFNVPVFGFGGQIGMKLSQSSILYFGEIGSLIIYYACIIAVILTTNLLPRTQIKNMLISPLRYAQRQIKQLIGPVTSEEDEKKIIKEAIMDLLQASQTWQNILKEPRKGGKLTSECRQSSEGDLNKNNNIASFINEAVSELSDQHNQESNHAISLQIYYKGKPHGKPSAKLFIKTPQPKPKKKEFAVLADKLTAQLREFKIEGKITKISEGPVVTTFEFEPIPGTKVSKITALEQDLARLLQARSLRILAPIPGKKVIGFEVPNQERQMIGFAEFVEHPQLKSRSVRLPIAMGVDAFGKPIVEDLTKMPHLLVAGSTGSGKSVFMNALIGGLICRHSAKDLRFIMIDPKMVELAAYNKLPHMACPVITDPTRDAKDALEALVAEMENRFELMRQLGARNIDSFNDIIKSHKKSQHPNYTGRWDTMPYMVLIIDELADMMMVLGREAEIPITRLAQKARAAGIHLVIATQRPSAEVVTGLIKANFPTRVAFRVLSGLDSRTILDTNGAEALLGQGDMLYLNAHGLIRMHGAYLSEKEVHAMVKAAST